MTVEITIYKKPEIPNQENTENKGLFDGAKAIKKIIVYDAKTCRQDTDGDWWLGSEDVAEYLYHKEEYLYQVECTSYD